MTPSQILAPVSVRTRQSAQFLTALGMAVVAFLMRLGPVVQGGGLFGLGNYDDGVYYAAAVGLVHGRIPYRDFLLLHPPGIVLALAPFAAVGTIVGDANGFALARIGWMIMGAASAVLVMVSLRRLGTVPAVIGGLFFAVFYPAVYSQHTTELEGLSTLLLLISVAVLSDPQSRRRPTPVLTAGVLLGIAAATKIWGVAGVVAVACWLLIVVGRRLAGRLVLGAGLGVTGVCLPFFLADPGAMMRMVVLDQLGRPQSSASPVTRLLQVVGQHGHFTAGLGVALTLVVLSILFVGAVFTDLGRLAAALLVTFALVLLLSPSWFPHYAALVAAPLAIMVGAGTSRITGMARRRGRAVASAFTVVMVGLVLAYGLPSTTVRLVRPFPATQLRAAVEKVSGCVTSDDPASLIELDVLSRNLDRRCLLVVDLGGRSYDDPPRPGTSRAHDVAFQDYALNHLRSGDVTIVARFHRGQGFSRATAKTVASWPVVQSNGPFSIRTPRA